MQYAGRDWLVGDEITHYRPGCLEAIHLAAWPHCRINIYVNLVLLWQLKLRTVWSSMESTEQQTKRDLKYAAVPVSHRPITLPFRFERRRLWAGLGSSVGCKVVARTKFPT